MRLQITTHEVSIQEMTARFIASFTDIISDLATQRDTDALESILKDGGYVLMVLSLGNIDAVRQVFKDGHTMQILPTAIFELIDSPHITLHEIRIFDNEQILGVIIDSEIKY